MDDRPIGIFDSGVGGLTVFQEVRARMPAEDLIYFGDTARVPYGGKSIPIIRRFSLEILRFLEAMKVKMVVVACNTASALALDFLRRQTQIPVIGVIEPGVRAALQASPDGRIGVIGTKATIASEAYQVRLKRLRDSCRVFAKACPLFVPLVEENLGDTQITQLALELYLDEFRAFAPETLILACTHYPLLKSRISSFFQDRVRLVDSAQATAVEVETVLKAMRAQSTADRVGRDEFYVSDSPEHFSLVGGQFLGRSINDVFLEAVWQREPGSIS
jgi:glutamate racemase